MQQPQPIPQGNPGQNVQQVQEPQPGQITGDPNLDVALANIMEAIPKNGDQLMAQLLTAMQPYLVQPGTEQAQGNPLEQGV